MMPQAVLRFFEFWKLEVYGLWENAVFGLNSQNLHLHSKVNVIFRSNFTCKFVYFVGTYVANGL